MDINSALIALSALSQETRLQLFRLLIPYGREGVPAGVISEKLGIPHNTLSFHLTHLKHAGLVVAQRRGRSIIYAANCDVTEELIAFLVENCCTEEKGAVTRKPLCVPVKGKARRSKEVCC